MRILFLLILTIGSVDLTAQSLSGTAWHTNSIIGRDTSMVTYTLRASKESSDENPQNNMSHYGNITTFNNDGTFTSSHSAPCGNDCFPSSLGTYEMIGPDRVRIFLKEFNQRGYCESIHRTPNKELGVFKISKIDYETWQLELE